MADWLEQNFNNSKLVTLDIRKVENYKEGHIPGAVNAFFGSWIMEKNGLLLEVPPDDDLLSLIGPLGIKSDSIVVVVGGGENDMPGRMPLVSHGPSLSRVSRT